jgi:hypothetical protein
MWMMIGISVHGADVYCPLVYLRADVIIVSEPLLLRRKCCVISNVILHCLPLLTSTSPSGYGRREHLLVHVVCRLLGDHAQ